MTETVKQRVALGGRLSERELAVLRGMSQGKSNGQIGAEMYLSEDTVKTHARRMFRKLGAIDRAHAVWLGVVRGDLPLPVEPATSVVRQLPPPTGPWNRRPGKAHMAKCFTVLGCQCRNEAVTANG